MLLKQKDAKPEVEKEIHVNEIVKKSMNKI